MVQTFAGKALKVLPGLKKAGLALWVSGALAGSAAGAVGTSVKPVTAGIAPPASPVARNGQLKVCGTFLCNQQGQPIQLRGMSSHGLQWYGWGSCLRPASLDALATDWRAQVMRVSLYVQEEGYATDPVKYTAMADQVIDALIQRGLYVLIDWHMLAPGDPMFNLSRARTYFTHMAQRYGHSPHVLYEIANEPNGHYLEQGHKHRVDWPRIQNYAQQLIPVIRKMDPDGVVIVGTPDWSSLGISGGSSPAEVYKHPLTGPNLMYSFHFYAASHGEPYRQALAEAAAHLPIFVTEWGSQQYTGDGPNDFASAQAFLDLMERFKISWTSWNYSDDQRSGAVFVQGSCASGGPWKGQSLKPAGQWVREQIRKGVSQP